MGQRLRKSRKRIGLSLQDVADLAGTCVHTIRRWESDLAPLKPSVLVRVASILNVSMEYLLPPLPPQPTFAEKLIYYRWLNGWTQMEMAKHMGISEDSLRVAEHGRDIRLVQAKAAQLDKLFFGEHGNSC